MIWFYFPININLRINLNKRCVGTVGATCANEKEWSQVGLGNHSGVFCDPKFP